MTSIQMKQRRQESKKRRRSSRETKRFDCTYRLHILLFLTTFSPLVSARKQKRYKRQRKSKWSTGVIKKPKKKKAPSPPSSSSSSSSSSSRENSEAGPEENGVVEMRALNGSADPSSSSTSESSDWEQNHLTATVNGYHHHLNSVTGIQNGGLVNGYHHPEPMDLQQANGVPRVRLNLRSQTSNPPPPLKRTVNGVCLSKTGLYVSETEVLCECSALLTLLHQTATNLLCCSFRTVFKTRSECTTAAAEQASTGRSFRLEALQNSGPRAKLTQTELRSQSTGEVLQVL